MASMRLQYQDQSFEIRLKETQGNFPEAVINGEELPAQLSEIDANSYSITHDGRLLTAKAVEAGGKIYVWVNGESYLFQKIEKNQPSPRPGMEAESGSGNTISAPMPGKILKILVKKGQAIAKNERLFIVEAMKMENEVKSPREGVVKNIHFQENDLVSVGETVVELEILKKEIL